MLLFWFSMMRLCVDFWIWPLVHREVLFPIVWERVQPPVVFLECTPLQFFGMSCRRLQWVAWIFVLCNSQLLSSWIFFTAFSLRLLSLCDSFACTSRPCNSSFDQLRLPGVIGSKFHICNFDLGFPRIAPSVETFTTQNISECYFWSSRGIKLSCE